MQKLKQYKQYFYTYNRFGNDRSGNPIYNVNIYIPYTAIEGYENINLMFNRKRDKHDNIHLQSYCIDTDIHFIIDRL